MARSPSAQDLWLGGVAAGLAVGVMAGVRAGVGSGLSSGALAACVALAVGVCTLAGGGAGAAAAGLSATAVFGSAGRPGRLARAAAWSLVGGAAGAVAASAVVLTAARRNRWLAAGTVAVIVLGVAVLAALLGPALARLLAYARGRRAGEEEAPPGARATAFGITVAAPLVCVISQAAPFWLLWHQHVPIPRGRLRLLAILVAAIAAALPCLLARAARFRIAVFGRRAAAAAAIAWAALTAVVLRARWLDDFRYLPWRDLATAAAIAVLGVLAAWALSRRAPLGRRWSWGAAALWLGAGVGGLLAAGHEPARKAAIARAGLVEPVLARARALLDRDRDGFSRWLGGDCDDRDPTINPGAQDFPDDEIDQDCDGEDARLEPIAAPPLPPVPAGVPEETNLVLVTIDTLRADRLGAYGYGRPTSSHLDALARDGTLFENGWAHAPSTRYSMPAIATGRWPSAIAWEPCVGCASWWPRIAPGQRTLGQAMKDAGYATGALYAYEYFRRGEARGFERGIDDYQDRRAALHRNVNGPMESVGSSAREIADDAIAFVTAHRGRKFFLWIHFYDPHLSYERHAEAPDFGATPADLYDGEIWFTDRQFGRVVDALRALGLYDRTAILVTGDHGEGLGERGIHAHGYHLYAPQTKVPFILRVPGVPPRRVRAPVSHVDVAPTLANLARGRAEPSFLGRSMLDLAAGTRAGPDEPVFQEVSYEGPTSRRALVTATHHLIWNWVPDNTTECYDLAADPGETRDLWAGPSAGDECARLARELRRRVAALSLPPGYVDKIARFVSSPGSTPPAPRIAHDVRFGAFARLAGVDLSADRIAPGGSIELTWHFDVLAPPPEGWRLFVHLDGPAGYRNLDHVPVEGAYPVERWRSGQRVRDRQVVDFPPGSPAGTYTVSLGFWRGGARAPIDPASAGDGQGRFPAARIVVGGGAGAGGP